MKKVPTVLTILEVVDKGSPPRTSEGKKFKI
jgi:hypothetical protein